MRINAMSDGTTSSGPIILFMAFAARWLCVVPRGSYHHLESLFAPLRLCVVLSSSFERHIGVSYKQVPTATPTSRPPLQGKETHQ